MSIRDTRMYQRALSQRWPIPQSMREEILAELVKVLRDPAASPREKTSAAKALMSADRLNIEEEKITQDDQHHADRIDLASLHRIAEVARSIGLDDIATKAIEAGSDRDTIRDDADQ